MGTKTSKQQQDSSSHGQNVYQSNVRAYSTWNHRAGLASDDVTRFVTQEIQNLNRHNQLPSISVSRTPVPQKKAITSSKNEIRSSSYKQNPNQQTVPKILRDEPITRGKNLGLRKSRSVENLASSTTFVTAHQLLQDQAKRRKRNKSPSSQISSGSSQNQGIEKSTSTSTANRLSSSTTKRKKIPNDLQFALINPNELQNAREIGKGNFGTVYHAIYKGNRHVALKTLNAEGENPSKGSTADYDQSMYELLHEANVMTRLKHANLLRIIGVTFFGSEHQLSLVTDFMKNGSLLNYLRKRRESFLKSDSRSVTLRLNSFAKQIFEAMLYLEERSIIHRDLAARNCLIGEGDTLKVGDFGLTTLTECGLYKGTYRSVCAPRWTAPEAVFSSKYSSRSDVWSYGITLWEIYSLGDRPFGGINNFAVQMILKNSSENLSRHLPQPQQFGSDETYTHIILLCLTYNVLMRPRFRDLKERLLTILSDKS